MPLFREKKRHGVYTIPHANWSYNSIASDDSNVRLIREKPAKKTTKQTKPSAPAPAPVRSESPAEPAPIRDPYEELARVLQAEFYRPMHCAYDLYGPRSRCLMEPVDYEVYSELWQRLKTKIMKSREPSE
ncbi:hypothetical protein VHEMI09520 [[Torrubiella] hemipterigena]|uniref:Uncharacterized protein n=1 Tax=[Torrubiella] hemipterigena TaxID=1531966 RepID=A0A0A1TQF9_9HYPO|nr:hypothetical protein VHEMI09520 [[Torrubiella] hemipterigena]